MTTPVPYYLVSYRPGALHDAQSTVSVRSNRDVRGMMLIVALRGWIGQKAWLQIFAKILLRHNPCTSKTRYVCHSFVHFCYLLL